MLDPPAEQGRIERVVPPDATKKRDDQWRRAVSDKLDLMIARVRFQKRARSWAQSKGKGCSARLQRAFDEADRTREEEDYLRERRMAECNINRKD